MAEPKRRNDVSNVIWIISDATLDMKDTCEMYITEFPQLMKEDKPPASSGNRESEGILERNI